VTCVLRLDTPVQKQSSSIPSEKPKLSASQVKKILKVTSGGIAIHISLGIIKIIKKSLQILNRTYTTGFKAHKTFNRLIMNTLGEFDTEKILLHSLFFVIKARSETENLKCGSGSGKIKRIHAADPGSHGNLAIHVHLLHF
jgi:hypothetical protein